MRIYNRLPSKSRVAGFTLVELMIASSIAVLAGLALVSLIKFSGYSMLDITQQTELNNAASKTTFQIIRRIRYSHTLQISNDGNTLTLSFDDDPEADADGDGDFYNDTDHQELFKYAPADTAYNSINVAGQSISLLTTSNSAPRTLLTDALPIGTLAIFTENAKNPRQIDINFKLRNQIPNNPRTQKIEISTSAYRVNGY